MTALSEKVTIVIKTFIRYQTLRKTVDALQRQLPGIPILVVDDTPMAFRKEQSIPGVEFIVTEPDIGLCAGRNLLFQRAKTDFVLYTDDDAPPTNKLKLENVEELVRRLENGEADLVGWRGWFLDEKEWKGKGKKVVCHRVAKIGDFTRVEMTENAYLARRQMLLDHPYDERIKINGEHFSYFLLLKRAGVKVAASRLFLFRNTKTRNKDYEKYRKRDRYRKEVKQSVGYWQAVWTSPLPPAEEAQRLEELANDR